MFKKNTNKIVIIFVIFLSFLLLGQWCYYSFFLPNEDEEIEMNDFQYEVKNVPEIAHKDFLLFVQQINADEKKKFKRKKVDRESIEKNIEILKDQGIWDGLLIETKVNEDFEKCYNSIQDLRNAFQLQLNELLEEVEEEKDLENFREELKELRKKHGEYISILTEFGQIVQKEAERPMPFFATWIGLASSVTICFLISLFLLPSNKEHEKQKESTGSDEEIKNEIIKNEEIKNNENKKEIIIIEEEINTSSNLLKDEPELKSKKEVKIKNIKKDKLNNDKVKLECPECLKEIPFYFFILYLLLQFLIFPLIDCLLSLKMSTFREVYRHYFANKFKTLFLFTPFICLFVIPIIWILMSSVFEIFESVVEDRLNKSKTETKGKKTKIKSEGVGVFDEEVAKKVNERSNSD